MMSITVGLTACGASTTVAWQPPNAIRFADATQASGIDFIHSDGSTGNRYIVETLASGLALLDYDLDGDIDIYFLSASPLPADNSASEVGKNRLYRNDGHGIFNDVTDESGTGDVGFGLGVAVADYDNDGWPDIYVSNFGPNSLYHNCGDGTFVAVAGELQVQCGSEVGAGVCFVDVNSDGLVDLYVANYVQFSIDKHSPTVVDGVERYSSPKMYAPERDYLFLNTGTGFRDATADSGIANHVGTGMGAIAFDFDDDNDQDIIVLNDVRPNFLFQNDGTGKFDEAGLLSGLAFNYQGNVLGSMGVDAADYNHDGLIDLFQTSFSTELPVLRKNLGGGFFDDVTRSAGMGLGMTAQTNWGVSFADFDNDGYSDLFIANGHLFDNVHEFDDRSHYEEPNQIFWNNHEGRFINVTPTCGPALELARSSRGCAVADLNEDGLMDIVVLNSRKEPTLLENSSVSSAISKNNWLDIALHGTASNRDGIGAKVSLTAGEVTQTQVIVSGRGYQSHWGTKLHFGLGTAKQVTSISVTWPSGTVQMINDGIPINAGFDIIESE